MARPGKMKLVNPKFCGKAELCVDSHCVQRGEERGESSAVPAPPPLEEDGQLNIMFRQLRT
jgi:hypothetical protein